MPLITPLRQDIENPVLVKKYSASLRMWHWANSLVICGSLLTVLLNSTLLDVPANTAYIKSQLEESGTVVTEKQAFSAAHGLEDRVWDIHIYFGYALAALLLFRLVTELYTRKDQKFLKKLKAAYQDYFVFKKNRYLARHELFVKVLYALFYGLLSIMAVTGLAMAFKQELGIGKEFNHSIKEFHGFCMYLILAFIVLHVAGVFLAERKDSRGIVSDMINGGRQTE
ncbi:Ni/Fe-hydrogenase 1 B-type cytochrome subunit [Pedobacter sp. CG_S7]|uniref:cytochrome b/b6 domain-containing protein n=1 Tax=Pedobacter sp. CG_S7 TaxID=3143930 RepID=UPI0033910D98